MSPAAHGTRGEQLGSVAEEAARLIGLFSTGLDADLLARAGDRAAGFARGTQPGAGSAPNTSSSGPGDTGASPGGCPTCGHQGGPAPVESTCKACPVCRVLALVRAVSPDALERAAEVVDLLSDGLRSYAGHRREALLREQRTRERPPGCEHEQPPSPPAPMYRDVTAEFFGEPGQSPGWPDEDTAALDGDEPAGQPPVTAAAPERE